MNQAIGPAGRLDAAGDKDLPLREDIRLLGRLLGDTLQEQEGPERFELVENIRRTAVRFHRDRDPSANGEVRLDWPFTQSDLAAMIGGTRQSVNKLLSRLVEDGLVLIERDTLVIHDLDALEERAER